MSKRVASIIVSLFALFTMGQGRAVVLSFNPTTSNVQLGDIFSVDIRISGLGDGEAPSLGTFDLDVSFDAAVINVTSLPAGVVFGDQLDQSGLGSITGASFIAGGINLFEISFDSVEDLNNLQAADFTIATLQFEALSEGTGALEFSNSVLGDELGDVILPTELGTGIVNIGVVKVPEPTILALMGLGLASLGFVRHRKKRDKSHGQNQHRLL